MSHPVIAPSSFVVDGPNSAIDGWTVVSAADENLQIVRDVTVTPHSEYLFSATVCSADRVVAQVGQRHLGYTSTGAWQTLSDVVRSNASGDLRVRIDVGGLAPTPGRCELRDISLRAVDLPSLPSRRDALPIVLGADTVAIVHPHAHPDWGLRLQSAIQRATGVRLPTLADTEVATADTLAIRDPYRAHHLILLGRLGLNCALGPAYHRFQAAADGYYPGGDGYVVRTALDVLGSGAHHIVLGGSTDTGVDRALHRFVELIEALPHDDATGTALPWLLDVELGGACRDAFAADDALWRESPFDPALPPLESGYGTIVRWYWNVMGYYWSGQSGYRERARAAIEPVLADAAYTHHYISEFMVRAYRMVDRTDLFDAVQRDAMDALILQNFWQLLTGPDLSRMEAFAPPFVAIPVHNRHNIAPWMGDLAMAEFLQSRFALTGDLAAVVAYRHSQIAAMLDHCVSDRWNSSFPSIAGSDNDEEVVASFFRYALEHGRSAFFSSDNARRALLLDKIDHVNGRFTRPAGMYDYHLVIGMAAHCYQDGRYKRLLSQLPEGIPAARLFQNRYINGVHRYVPGPELAAESTASLAGVAIPQMQPHNRQRLLTVQPASCQLPTAGMRVFDRATFRSGFGPADDYIALSGTAGPTPAGVFTAFAAAGHYWLGAGDSAVLRPPSQHYFDHNAVHVQRTDAWDAEPRPYASAAKHLWHADFGASGGVAFRLAPMAGTSWERQVIWLARGLAIVCDTVTADADGAYDIIVSWHPVGRPTWQAPVWRSHQGTSWLQLVAASPGFSVQQNAEAVAQQQADTACCRFVWRGDLAAGASVSATTVLQAGTAEEQPCTVTTRGADALTLTAAAGQNVPPVTVSWAPHAATGLATDAALVAVSGDDARVCHGTHLRTAGQTRFSSEAPASGRVKLPECLPPGPAAAATRPAPAGRDDDTSEAPLPACEWATADLQAPALVRGVEVREPGLVDLGHDVIVAEIRAGEAGGRWRPRRLPDGLALAPAAAPDDWRPVSAEPAWRPGIATGNYGQAEAVPDAFQTVTPEARPVRYARGTGVETALFFDRERLAASTPLALALADIDGDADAEILVMPEPWPPFVRKRIPESGVVLALRPDGELLYRHAPFQNIQEARLLPVCEGAAAQLVVTTVDAAICVLAGDGEVADRHDLFAMRQRFNEQEGRPNTRHPAGGYTMPYSVGLWRRDDSGRASIVVAGYCGFSFIDSRGMFEGILGNVGYVNARLLPEGLDFSGTGADEQLALGKDGLHHIDGDGAPYVQEPGGHRFYPQVYQQQFIRAPAAADAIDGARVFVFTAISLQEQPRYVLVVRADYLGIYDGRNRRWVFVWTPRVHITAATVIEDSVESLSVLAATADQRLWQLSWRGTPEQLAAHRSAATPTIVRRCRRGTGRSWLAAADGLYAATPELALERVVPGDFQDVIDLPYSDSIVAITGGGEVRRYGLSARQ
jgi:hypothetical protein